MGFYIFGHGGSGDHGNEDRLRGICALLPEQPEVYSACPEEDWRYGLGALGGVYRSAAVSPPVLEREDWSVELMPSGLRRGRRICWAPSEYLGSGAGLHRYEAVVVTEGRSQRHLTGLGLKNVVRAPEPAFLVGRRFRPRQGAFGAETVGLCLTLPVAAGSLLYRCYQHLIRCILRETSLEIALIPYSVKMGQNDCLLLKTLAAPYLDTGRVHLRPDGDSCQLRGDLSRCLCCVGGEGVVAAWGCGVPGLCLCANHRTMGLSRDLLGSWEIGVCPWETLTRQDSLTQRFQILLSQSDRLRSRLEAR